jgi:type II secretory pathway predicted ATPase ExeA
VIEGESGVGKTALLRTAMARLRRQRVRMAHSSLAAGWDRAIEDLARGLGSHSSGLDPWARLDRCLKAARLERTRVVLALDDCASSADSEKHLQSLEKLAERGNVPLTLLVSRSGELDDPDDGPEQEKWVALVHPLTRDETDRFLTSKLAAAGCSAPLFTSRAVTRLHGLSRGFPRRIEAMAIECLFRVERLGTPPITADLVDASAAGLA